ncbi:MAG: hypothetical protein PVF15_09295 [Candidatus Bathyarchaeota archaeon]|jgi:hypothetical protein
MIALITTGIIFSTAIVVIPNLTYVNLLYVDQQQLRNTALGTMKAMLLYTGYPVDWGSAYTFTPDHVERFGLALAGSSSFYELDPEKVQRLVAGNPSGSIGYDDIRTKMELQDYGFNFRIIPPFKVTVNDVDFDGESNPLTLQNLTDGVDVYVTYNHGSPIPKASIKATLLYVDKWDDFFTVEASNSTNLLGRCTINPNIQSNPDDIEDFVIVFKVSVAEVTTITSSYMEGFENQHVMNTSIVGENITLTIPEGPGWEKDSAGVRYVVSITLVTADEIRSLYNGTKSEEDKIQWGGDNWAWSKIFSGIKFMDTAFLIFNLDVPNPRRLIYIVGPHPNWAGSRVEAFGDADVTRASAAVKISRTVLISGLTYIAELTLWKETS